MLELGQFKKLEKYPIKMIENKMKRTLRKIKNYFDEKEYKKLYPTGSRPRSFHETAKVHKLGKGEDLNELTIRSIFSNIETATYETAKYLNSLLSLIGKSERELVNTETFIKHIKGQRIRDDSQMISFDIKSLLASLPLNETVNVILKKVYDENKIVTNILRSALK